MWMNLNDRLGKTKKSKIAGIGIELEGGWDAFPSGDTELHHDGSVQIIKKVVSNGCPELMAAVQGGTVHMDNRNRYYYVSPSTGKRVIISRDEASTGSKYSPSIVGEAASPKLTRKSWEEWVRKYYPSTVNETCGLHVHMSFINIFCYQRLMVKDFQDTLVEYLGRWAAEKLASNHHIFDRLAGHNRYCKGAFFPAEQSMASQRLGRNGGEDPPNVPQRYTILNYCFKLHQTIECRVMPMFDTVDLAIGAIQLVLDTTDAFLSYQKREPKLVLTDPSQIESHVEEYKVCV